MHDHKHIVDGTLVSIALTAFVGGLPTIAAFFALVLTVMRIVNEWDAFIAKVKGWWK